MTHTVRLILIIWTVLILLAAALLYWLFFIEEIFKVADAPAPNTEVAAKEEKKADVYLPAEALYGSTAYEEIRSYIALGDVEKVKTLFGNLQGLYATGTSQRNVVDYDLAFYEIFSNPDPSDGIARLQTIVAATSTYSSLTRALAMESLGRAASAFSKVEISAEIFGKEPFQAILSAENQNYGKAIMRLFRSAVDINPTAIAALRVAMEARYAFSVGSSTLSESEQTALREEYRRFMSIANEEAKLLEGRQPFNSYLADFYVTKAYTLGIPYFDSEPTNEEDISELYKKGIAFADGSSQLFAIFNYAVFLSRTNAGAVAEVDVLVSRLEKAPARSRQLFETNMRNSLASKKGNYQDMVRLSEYSPAFKAYIGRLQAQN